MFLFKKFAYELWICDVYLLINNSIYYYIVELTQMTSDLSDYLLFFFTILVRLSIL